jgi:acetoacetyl-CoA reductase
MTATLTSPPPLALTLPVAAPLLDANGVRRVALVTGGIRGIGRAIAEALLDAGYFLVVTYASNQEKADEMRQQFDENRVRVIQTDVSNETEVDALFTELIARYARLDVLVNNAGITQDRSFHKMDSTDWHKVMDVNLNGAFYCCNRAIPLMREQNFGRIVNISSIVGQQGNFGQANYAASKAGLLGLTKTLALENAQKGITVNAVCPGFIETDMVSVIPEPVKEKLQAQIPMKRFGSTLEVASAVRFLVSQTSGYITGQELNVNGGLLTS